MGALQEGLIERVAHVLTSDPFLDTLDRALHGVWSEILAETPSQEAEASDELESELSDALALLIRGGVMLRDCSFIVSFFSSDALPCQIRIIDTALKSCAKMEAYLEEVHQMRKLLATCESQRSGRGL